MRNLAVTEPFIGPLTTTGISCQDIYRCIVTDMEGTTSEVGQITIKPVTGKLYIYICNNYIYLYINCFLSRYSYTNFSQ